MSWAILTLDDARIESQITIFVAKRYRFQPSGKVDDRFEPLNSHVHGFFGSCKSTRKQFVRSLLKS